MDHSHMDHSQHMDPSVDHSSHAHHGHVGSDVGTTDVPDAGGSNCSFDMGHSMHSMGMMVFHFGTCEQVLFDSWRIYNVGTLIGSMFGIFLMAALYEGLKYYREYLFWKTYNSLQYRSVQFPSDKPVRSSSSEDNRIVQPTMLSWMHGFQTVLHAVQIVLSYFLMLIFMTYNVWLCIAVVFGAVVGYFLFGWKKSVVVDVTEHCH